MYFVDLIRILTIFISIFLILCSMFVPQKNDYLKVGYSIVNFILRC